MQNQQESDASCLPSTGFAPIARSDARVLILGSLPGQRSLRERQYYAHPQNSFWRIMQTLTGAEGAYEERCESLLKGGIALWDVLAESIRPGSMDADIQTSSAKKNDFPGFYIRHPDIELVCFNGKKAAKLYERFVNGDQVDGARRFETLPSTSPAYASMKYENKLALWRSALG